MNIHYLPSSLDLSSDTGESCGAVFQIENFQLIDTIEGIEFSVANPNKSFHSVQRIFEDCIQKLCASTTRQESFGPEEMTVARMIQNKFTRCDAYAMSFSRP
jgi:hypothetical protein